MFESETRELYGLKHCMRWIKSMRILAHIAVINLFNLQLIKSCFFALL